ncbi:MAG: hypothetical protein ACYTHN_12975 [Planctomycetota bacterium]|jgi:hypothetical protein
MSFGFTKKEGNERKFYFVGFHPLIIILLIALMATILAVLLAP